MNYEYLLVFWNKEDDLKCIEMLIALIVNEHQLTFTLLLFPILLFNSNLIKNIPNYVLTIILIIILNLANGLNNETHF